MIENCKKKFFDFHRNSSTSGCFVKLTICLDSGLFGLPELPVLPPAAAGGKAGGAGGLAALLHRLLFRHYGTPKKPYV